MERRDDFSSFIFYMGDRCLCVSIVVFNNANGLGKFFRGLSTAEPVSMPATGEHDPLEFDPSWLFPDRFAGRQWCPRSLFRRNQAKRVCHLTGYVKIPVFNVVGITGLKW